MKKHIIIASLAAALSCGTTMAFAGSNTDVSQVLDGVQSALNSISVNGNSTNVKQSATNAANLINQHSNLGTVGQSAAGPQTATNSAITQYGMWDKIIQDATNVANSVDLTKTNTNGKVTDSWNVATVSQSATGTQQATNGVVFTQAIDEVAGKASKQNATNAANLVSVGDITTSVTQNFSGGSQYASDSATIRSGVTPTQGAVTMLSQAAANVANSIDADSVVALSQAASAPQTALNTITFGPGMSALPDMGLSSSSQDATNAANIASLDTLTHNSSQLATLTQNAANSATYVGGTPGAWPAANGSVDGLKQTGTNAANILTATTLPSLSGVTEVAQTASGGFNQSVSNSILTAGSVRNVSQSATNVVNSLSLPN